MKAEQAAPTICRVVKITMMTFDSDDKEKNKQTQGGWRILKAEQAAPSLCRVVKIMMMTFDSDYEDKYSV